MVYLVVPSVILPLPPFSVSRLFPMYFYSAVNVKNKHDFISWKTKYGVCDIRLETLCMCDGFVVVVVVV